MMNEFFYRCFEEPWNLSSGAWRALRASLLNDAGNISFADLDFSAPEATVDANLVGHLYVEGVLTRNESPLNALFGEVSYEKLGADLEMLEQASEAIVIHVDSPGGQANGNIEFAQQIQAIEIPTLAAIGSTATSAGYAISAGCDRIVSQKSSIVGSIGTILPLVDETGLWEKMGIADASISSGDLKGAGYGPAPTPEQREALQSLVDSLFGQFRSFVLSNRSLDNDDMRGQSFSGEQALERGLIDSLDSYESEYARLTSQLQTP